MNKTSKQLFLIARQLDKIAANDTIKVDDTEHSFSELATWIIEAADVAFSKFLSDNKFDRQNFKAISISVILQKDKTGIHVQLQPENPIEQIKSEKKEINYLDYETSYCVQNTYSGSVVAIQSVIDTNKFLPLLRSVPNSYKSNGNLTNQAISEFRKALYDTAKKKYN